MNKYFIKRLLQSVPVLLLSSIIIFSILHFTPGDPAYFVAGLDATPEVLEAVRIKMGLNKPFYEQYYLWLSDILSGNFGNSAINHQPVSKLILGRLPATIHFTLSGFILTIILSFLIGIPAGLKPNSIVDYFCSIYSALAFGIPVFWLGILLILLFSVILRILPPSGYISIFEDPVLSLKSLMLPTITLALANSGALARFIKFSILEITSQDYIRTARSKGLLENVIVRRHVLKNAMIPVLTVATLMIGGLLGGVVVIEVIFAWPGIGRLLLEALNNRDYPVVQGTLLFVVFIIILVNLLTDLLYIYFDPRIKYV